jgi:hypothetical protein
VPAASLRELRGAPGEPTAAVTAGVAAAGVIQRERFGPAAATPVNANMGPETLRRHCTVDPQGRTLLDTAFERRCAGPVRLAGRSWTGPAARAALPRGQACSEAVLGDIALDPGCTVDRAELTGGCLDALDDLATSWDAQEFEIGVHMLIGAL